MLINIIIPFHLSAQEILVEIDKRIFDEAICSFIIVTNESNHIIYEEKLLEFESNKNHEIQISKTNDNEKFNLTIYNEYTWKHPDESVDRYFKSCSYLDIKDYFFVDNIFDYEGPPKPDAYFKILTNIYGVSRKNEAYHYGTDPFKFNRVTKKRNKLKVRATIAKEMDYFSIFRCNDEDTYRYFYLEADSILAHNSFQYDELSEGLTLNSIQLSTKDKWSFIIYATNKQTLNDCHLYHTQEFYFDNKVSFFTPTNEEFYNYSIDIKKEVDQNDNTKICGYQIYSDEVPETIDFPEIEYEYELDFEDEEKGFTILYTPESDSDVLFTMTYIDPASDIISLNYSDYYINNSSWNIIGHIEEEVKFEFPILPKYYNEDFLLINTIQNLIPSEIKLMEDISDNKNYYFIEMLNLE